MTGDVAAVKSAVEAGAMDKGLLTAGSNSFIPQNLIPVFCNKFVKR